MAFCSKCGAEIKDGSKFCEACGANTGADKKEGNKMDFSDAVSNFNNTDDYTSGMDRSDVENNKAMGVLAYLSWLVLIPLFAAKDSKFARFHTNQGIVLAIFELIWWVVEGIIAAVFSIIPVVGLIVNLVLGLVNILFLVLAIIGIVNAINGKAKELPIIGKIRVIK